MNTDLKTTGPAIRLWVAFWITGVININSLMICMGTILGRTGILLTFLYALWAVASVHIAADSYKGPSILGTAAKLVSIVMSASLLTKLDGGL